MSRFTPRFGLQVIEPGDDPYQNGHKFFAADRDTIDTILWLAMAGHVHDGAVGATEPPDTAPELELDTIGGTIGAGARIWYTYTLVNQLTGLETGPAPVSFIDTPEPIDSPDSPTLSWGSLSGTLLPGQYFYILTAWTDANTNETKAENAIGVIVSPGTNTNRIIITLPELPDGADGFNIYRRTPGGTKYLHLAEVDMTVATPPTQYIDDGTVEEDCDRTAPYKNTTNSTNTVTITYPGATPTVPVGYFWKIYRTVSENDWSASLLTTVVEETEENSGIITPVFVDEGFDTTTGEPPSGTFDYDSPGKIDLTDAAHVTGYLPMGRVSAFPYVVTLFFPGTQTEGVGDAEWPCPFPEAKVIHAVAALGRGSAPAADDLIADVVIGKGTTPTFTSVYAAEADMPTIEVGENKTDTAAVATGTLLNRTIELGDVLSADIIQAGGGATPTDEDLTVNVLLYVHIGDEDVSEVWA